MITSGAGSLLKKASLYLILTAAVFAFHFLSGKFAGTQLLIGFLIGLAFFLFESALFRLLSISITMFMFVSMDFRLRSGTVTSAIDATRANSDKWIVYSLFLFLFGAIAWYLVKRNKLLLHGLKADCRKVETALEKEVMAGQKKTTFIRNAYHEIRSQFWGVFMIIKILSRTQQTGQADDVNKMFSDLTNGCQNLQLLLANIMEYSKFESGILEIPVLEPVNPRLKIGELVDLCQYAAKERNIRINYRSADDIPDYLYCDGMKLTQVIINLINNAVKFARPNTIVDVTVYKDVNRWRISVKDHGKGIHPDKLPYIFDLFVTDKKNNNSEGVGLGLYIAKQLVAELQGDIHVSSQENAGSCFIVCLPVVPADRPSGEE